MMPGRLLLKMPGVNELYSAYFYDQLSKLWVQKMCNKVVGISKIWPKEKAKRTYLAKMPVIKQPVNYYEELKREKLEKDRARKKLAQKKYYENNRAMEIKKRLDRYYKMKINKPKTYDLNSTV